MWKVVTFTELSVNVIYAAALPKPIAAILGGPSPPGDVFLAPLAIYASDRRIPLVVAA